MIVLLVSTILLNAISWLVSFVKLLVFLMALLNVASARVKLIATQYLVLCAIVHLTAIAVVCVVLMWATLKIV
jgi:hypothetical protein